MLAISEADHIVIGGDLVEAASGETFESIDPSTGQAFAQVAKAGGWMAVLAADDLVMGRSAAA